MSMSRLLEIWEPIKVAPADQDSTASYVDVAGSKMDIGGKGKVVYTIANTGANSIYWKVLASVDDVTYAEVKAEASLAASGSSSFEATAVQASYKYFKVQIKNNAGVGTAQVRGHAKV